MDGNRRQQEVDDSRPNRYAEQSGASVTGSTLAANRAWLPKEMVSQNNQDNLAFGKHSIRFSIAPGTTSIASPTLHKKEEKEMIYNLNGQQVDKTSAQGGIFISRQKGKFYKAPGSSGGSR